MSTTRIVGIDPGAAGACVLLEAGAPVEWMLMPVMREGKASRVNGAALASWLRAAGDVTVAVEAVHAMPGQGVSSMFSFGHSVGVVMGVLATLELPVMLLTPQAWKKAAGLIGTDKDAARSRAIQMWPAWRDLDKKGAGQALADAALIARAGGGHG